MLNLPNYKGPSFPAPILSMDEYFEFVEWYRENFFDKEVYEFWNKKNLVNERFVIQEDRHGSSSSTS